LEDEIIGDMALVPEMYNDEYWLDGRYNNQDFKVVKGIVT
jgi:hypothetical protein